MALEGFHLLSDQAPSCTHSDALKGLVWGHLGECSPVKEIS